MTQIKITPLHDNLRGRQPTQHCGDCPIRYRAVCARCETDELAALEAIKYDRMFEAGQTVVWSGDRLDFVGSVISGVATLTQTLEDGRTQMVGLLLITALMHPHSPIGLPSDVFDNSTGFRTKLYWANLITIACVTPINFVLNKLWTFRAVRRHRLEVS